MSAHRVWLDSFPDRPGTRLTIGGEEGHHAARVRRVKPQDLLELIDGTGRIGQARVIGSIKSSRREWEVECEVIGVRQVTPVAPLLEVWSAVPKGERLEQMIDALTQVGAAGWSPLSAERSVVEPREGKITRLSRVVREACKQCGRAWAMTVGRGGTLRDAIQTTRRVVMADGSGEPRLADDPRPAEVRLLIGPEGGWTDDERAEARAAGAAIVRFGPHAMRIETAAPMAAGIMLNA